MPYTEKDRERKKQYYEMNKEIILKRGKEYKDNNKDQLKEKASEKIKCECGCELRRDKLTKHQTTKKHENKLIHKFLS